MKALEKPQRVVANGSLVEKGIVYLHIVQVSDLHRLCGLPDVFDAVGLPALAQTMLFDPNMYAESGRYDARIMLVRCDDCRTMAYRLSDAALAGRADER